MRNHTHPTNPNDSPSNNSAQEDKDKGIIETASATTSPDNSNSGPFAYIITAVALIVTIAITILGAGCASLVLVAMANDYGSDYSGGYSTTSPLDEIEDLEDIDDIEEWLERYTNDMDDSLGDTVGNNHGSGNTSSTSVSVDDALDFDIAAYSSTIDGGVSASSYAGTAGEVRDFVRTLLTEDTSYADRVAQCLNTAALDTDARESKFAEAKTLCEECGAKLDALEIPAVQNDDNGEVKDALGTAKSDAIRRWELMANEIELLADGDQVNTKHLWNVDDDIIEATDDAANGLMDAMALAAH